jgi:hypothetical protein
VSSLVEGAPVGERPRAVDLLRARLAPRREMRGERIVDGLQAREGLRRFDHEAEGMSAPG